MRQLLHKTEVFLKRNSSTILTCVGAVGVVATAVLTAKATQKAVRIMDAAEEEKGEALTTTEAIKAAGTVYIPAVVVGASTIACIFGANALNKRQQAALMSAYALLDSSYKDYQNKVKEIHGEDAHWNIKKEIAKDKYEDEGFDFGDDKQLFYDEFSERYFEARMEDVLRAEYEINKKISVWGGAELNEFYELLGLEPVDYGYFLGWSSGGLMEMTWSDWLDFYHEKTLINDDLECILITMSTEPMYDYEYY